MYSNKLFGGALAAVVAWFLLAVGGQIEGRLFPVTERTEIIRIEAVGETYSRVWGRAHKRRNCSFHSLQFRLGTPRNFTVADAEFEEGTKDRRDGTFDFGPWLVQLTPEQLDGRAYVIAYHRCHPFWLTETRFYP